MPKTTVHEDRDALLGKNEVGIAEHWKVAAPTYNTIAAEQAHKGQFCALVSTRKDARHNSRALGFCKYIAHGSYGRVNLYTEVFPTPVVNRSLSKLFGLT